MMWTVLARYLVQGAIWCVDHPDTVKGIVDEVIALKNLKKGA